jgi:Lon protease-like protein
VSELPLFPLSGVLLPFGRIPLKIFEPRYLDLVRDSMKSGDPFGVVWIRQGAEVAQPGRASPQLGEHGTCARIVDWDQLPNGLLGITIEGSERFRLFATQTRPNGLIVGTVEVQPALTAAPLTETALSLLEVLRSLEEHPQVVRMKLRVDYNDAWQVAYTLLQLLPVQESLKYELLGLDNVDALLARLRALINEISGEG